MRKMTQILDVPFDALTMGEAVEKVKGFLQDGKQHYICTPNPEIVMEAQDDRELMKILREADLVVPDGIGVVWASRYSEIRLTERVAGYDLVQNLFKAIDGTNEGVYFFGGAPGVASAAARQMKKKYPNLQIVGGHNGYFDDLEEHKIISDIQHAAPSVLLVGLGAPKQEKWMVEHLKETGAKIAIGIGGSFDVMAGNVKRAPKVFQKLGLEWFYRLITQPTRWKRMMRLPKFIITVLRKQKQR